MIDHVSVPVCDLTESTAFYESVLSKIGFAKLVEKPGTVGFGKKYPEFWLNHRSDGPGISDGFQACLRTKTADQVKDFHTRALALATSDGHGLADFQVEPAGLAILGRQPAQELPRTTAVLQHARAAKQRALTLGEETRLDAPHVHREARVVALLALSVFTLTAATPEPNGPRGHPAELGGPVSARPPRIRLTRRARAPSDPVVARRP